MKVDRGLVLIAVLACGARLGAQLALGLYSKPEIWEYDLLAQSVLNGHGYELEHNGAIWHAASAPLYPALLIVAHAIGGMSPLPAGILNLLLGLALVLTVRAIASAPLGSAGGDLAAIGAALHPGLLVYSAKLHALNLDVVMTTLTVLAILTFSQRPDLKHGLLAGATTGAAALSRVTLLPVMAIGLGLFALRHRSAKVLAPLALAAVVAASISAPWVVRNAAVMGSWSLMPSSGEVLWRGNNPIATGGALAMDGRPLLDADPTMHEAVWGRDEIEQDLIFRQAAFAYVTADPLRAIRDAGRKLAIFWWFGPEAGALYPAQWLLPYQIYYVLVATFALVGGMAMWRSGRRWFVFVLVLTALVVGLFQSAFYVEGRHRWEVEPLLLILAVGGLIALARQAGRLSAART